MYIAGQMKRLVIVGLLLLFAYLQAGHFVHLFALRRTARQEFKKAVLNQLPDSVFNQFSLNDISSSLRWEEEGKEFWLNNQLYDVVKTTSVDGAIVLLCINDTKEQELVKTEQRLAGQNGDANGCRSTTPKFQFPYFLMSAGINSPLYFIDVDTHFSNFLQEERAQFYEPLSPPPQA